MKNSIFKQYPLLFRLVFYVIGFSLFVALFLSAVQLWYAYSRELSNIQEQLAELRVSHEDSLVKNIWNMDNEGVNIQLNSMLQIPDVVGVVFEDDEGKEVLIGEIPAKHSKSVIETFLLSKQVKANSVSLGKVTIYATPSELKKRLWRELPVSLLVEAIALLLTGSFILILFLVKYNRHINRIAEFTQNLEIDNIGKELTLDRNKNGINSPDELDRIVGSFNEMQSRVREQVEAQQQTEERLQHEIAFSDAIINSLPGVFVVFNEKLEAVLFNELYSEKLGLESSQAACFPFMERVAADNQQRLRDTLQDLYKNKKPVTLELELLSVDKEKIPYLFNGSYFLLEDQGYIIGLGTDLTDQKKMENMLNQAQKLEALGTLAGGIAHDFNNILSSILGNLQLAQIVAQDPAKLAEYLQSGVNASLRAKNLVGQILSMGRQEQLEMKSLQMSLIIQETVSLLRATIPTSIDIQQHLESNGYIWANATQIQQVLMNLCTNAYHAMQLDIGGTLTITLEEKEITAIQYFPGFDLPPGQYLSLEVTDTGCGMSQNTRKMIFQPYFTTRDKSSGTGLGLAVVHGIVQAHGGNITVYSEPGQGTIFRLYFPLLSDPVLSAEKSGVEKDLPKGTECLLLVDDEEEILNVYSDILLAYGYTVKTFSNSLDALSHFQDNPSAYDLVLTDMTMPDLSGDVLGQKIMEISPDVPVVICTGFSKKMEYGDSLNAGFAAYFTKPVEAGKLLRTIRKVLDENHFKVLNVLLADDDPYNQQVVTLLMQTQGHRVCIAENGKVCLQKISSEDFDVVFMDMQMPELDGLQTTTIIRACETGKPGKAEFEQCTGKSWRKLYGKHIPVVAMTGNLDEESRLQCKEAGMDDFLSKPFTIEAVTKILSSIAKKSIQVSENSNHIQTKYCNDDNNDLVARAMYHLQQQYPLNEEQLQQLLDESIRSIFLSLQGLEEGIIRTDFSILAKGAHKTKGTLLGIGMEKGVDLCKKLEESAKRSNIEESKRIFGNLKQLLHPLLEHK